MGKLHFQHDWFDCLVPAAAAAVSSLPLTLPAPVDLYLCGRVFLVTLFTGLMAKMARRKVKPPGGG